jgi:hypothetical protein
MINFSHLHCSNRQISRPWSARHCLPPLAALVALLSLVGCGDANQVRVRLQANTSREHDPRRLIIRAEVTGPQDQLNYRWFSQAGECIPQRTDTPATIFSFGEGKTTDRVVLEVWRGNNPVAQGEIAVKLTDNPPAEIQPKPVVHIEITDTPPYNPAGGPNTRAHIGGKLSGDLSSAMVVFIYARANGIWFIQPDPISPKHFLRSDHSFSMWTHTGSDYAVLVARPTFTPLASAEFLPLVENDILAHLIVEGERQ